MCLCFSCVCTWEWIFCVMRWHNFSLYGNWCNSSGPRFVTFTGVYTLSLLSAPRDAVTLSSAAFLDVSWVTTFHYEVGFYFSPKGLLCALLSGSFEICGLPVVLILWKKVRPDTFSFSQISVGSAFLSSGIECCYGKFWNELIFPPCRGPAFSDCIFLVTIILKGQ